MAPTVCCAASRSVFQKEFGAAWPLTATYGTLNCVGAGSVQVATFLEPGGKTWALNGIAEGRGFPAIDPIWKENPEIPGAKINIRPLIDAARALCAK